MEAGFFTITPTEILMSTKLSWYQKALYGDISAHSNSKGYCWGSNPYFAKRHKQSKEHVSRQIAILIEQGYLFKLNAINKEGNAERRLFTQAAFISYAQANGIDINKFIGDDKNIIGGDDKNIIRNNISNNNIKKKLSKDNLSDSGESQKKGNTSLNKRKLVKIIKPTNSAKSKDISDRQINKSKAKKDPVAKYKTNTTTEKCYIRAVTAGAIKHKDKNGKITKTKIATFDKLYKLFSEKCKSPYRFANNIGDYIDFKWTVEDFIDAFKFHLENEKNEKNKIRNIGKFIFTEGYNGYESWSPLLKWHSDMKKGITGELDLQGKILFKSLEQRKVLNIDKLHANDINRITKSILPIQDKYVFMNGKTTMDGYAYGIISVASKYIKDEKQNRSDFNWRWVTKNTFADELLEYVLKYNIMKKKTNRTNINYGGKLHV